MKDTFKYYILLTLIYFGIFWSFIQYSITGLFSYWDELYAMIFIPVFVYDIANKNIRKMDVILLVIIVTFSFVGVCGNLFNSYASIGATMSDVFLNTKFFMCLYLTMSIFNKIDIEIYRTRIGKHIVVLTYIFLLLFVLNRMLNLFPIYEIRFGISSEQLIFTHPTFCASAIFYLILLRVLFVHDLCKNKIDKEVFLTILLCVIVVFTLRFKAIATILLFIALSIYILNPYIRQLKWIIIVLGVGAVLFLSYEHILAYFTGYGLRNYPRGVLLLTSIKIMADYFPFGTGFGTFGSYMSGVHYSPVYYKYQISDIYGITKDNYNAMTDQYWPMIAGQTGVIGLICMVCVWAILFMKICTVKAYNKMYFIAALSSLIYILVSSTSESAVCNPACIPFAIILGLIFSQDNTNKYFCKDNESIKENL